MLEVLVGKTMEQALLEVVEEEELSNLREQQRAHEELRNGELMEQQRLEEQERRHREEKVCNLSHRLHFFSTEKMGIGLFTKFMQQIWSGSIVVEI